VTGNHPFTVTEPEGAWCVLAAGCHAGTAASTTSGTLTEAPHDT
jgi:hypothetical protein